MRSVQRAHGAAATVAAVMLWGHGASAQELEPRQYSNVPVAMNFAVVGYGESEGAVLFDPSVPLDNADLRVDGPVAGFARGINLGGLSAKVDAGVAHVCLSGSADFEGQRLSRHKCGLSDVKARLAVNFIGAPALTLREFAAYQQDLIVGASLQVGVPVGDYQEPDLINVGTNRWSARTEIGFSKVLPRQWIIEVALSGMFFEPNDEFRGDRVREQEPIYALQLHAVRTLRSGVWIAVDSTHYRGGTTETDGIEDRNFQSNTRVGLTVSVPISLAQSIKLYWSSGASTRTGTDFDTLGVAWQYRWGGNPTLEQ
jgi:hypothetical protein